MFYEFHRLIVISDLFSVKRYTPNPRSDSDDTPRDINLRGGFTRR